MQSLFQAATYPVKDWGSFTMGKRGGVDIGEQAEVSATLRWES